MSSSSIGRHSRTHPVCHVRTPYSVPGGAFRSVILRPRLHYMASLDDRPDVSWSDGLGDGASAVDVEEGSWVRGLSIVLHTRVRKGGKGKMG